ncbi:protein phosphatase 2C domain-containing protein [Dactylosporangium sp. NPDC051541]|uniref:protein phosphatase 2C domain-containing protein n=1 Tax=Dactylosporangium sp. NPDC051541 TaxID=3363977 RepID=UPI0037BD8CE9
MTDPFPPQWRVAGVSVPGPRHAAIAVANQDSWLYRAVNADVFVLAVADGAGSRPRSAVGSRLAVEAAFTSACAVLPPQRPGTGPVWAELAERWAGACRAAFTQAVEAVAGPLSTDGAAGLGAEDFATTLLAVLACPPWYCYLTVGDCFLVVHRRPGGAHLVVPPPIADPPGVTTFLTSPDAAAQLSCGVIDEPRLAGLALCSDGLIQATLDIARRADGAMCYLAPPDFAGFFEALADDRRTPLDLAAGLASPDYAATSGDDMTMVLAVRR